MLKCVTVNSVYGCRLVSILDIIHTEYYICFSLAQLV
jgi:hypothetical protein